MFEFGVDSSNYPNVSIALLLYLEPVPWRDYGFIDHQICVKWLHRLIEDLFHQLVLTSQSFTDTSIHFSILLLSCFSYFSKREVRGRFSATLNQKYYD